MDKSAEKFNVILATPTKASVRKVLKKLKNNQFAWAYFGENVSNTIAIERQIKNRGQRLEVGKKLQETAKELRQPYIDYIGNLSIENNSLRWWAGSISEKNPDASKTFLHACYIKTCQSFLTSDKQESDFVFFIENKSLMKSLIKNIPSFEGNQIKEIGMPLLDTMDNIREWAMMSLIKVWFIVESLNRIFLSKYFYKFNRFSRIIEKQKKGITLLHTFIDHRSFQENGKFHDSYLGELADRLRRRGNEVVIVPYVLNPLSPYILNITYYLNALKNMQKSGESFLLPYAFLSIRDIFSITYDILSSTPKKKDFPFFRGMEISDLLYDDLRREWLGITLPRDLIFYDVVRGWKKAGIKINSFIYPFENQTWEKVFCFALRELYPKTKIIGYQHSAISKMLLFYFFSSKESNIIPSPDRIITNGRYPEKLFKESGYNSQKVVCGGAIRYANVLEESKTYVEDKVSKSGQKCIVLIATSISRAEGAELIWKATKAFGHSDKYEVVIKCHPVMPYAKLAKDLGIVDVPKNFKLSQRSISKLLKEANVLLYTSSTTCIEALALGVPVIHVESDLIIDKNPLEFVSDSISCASSPDEISSRLMDLFSLDEKDLLEKRKQWKHAVGEVFSPVSNGTYSLFLNS